MDGENKKPAWKIWVYLTPVYILLAIPLVRWTMKINSPDVALSKDEYGAFNSSKGSVKDANPDQYKPELNYSAYSLHYRSGKEEGEIKLHTSDEGSGQGNGGARAGNGQGQDRAQAGNQQAGRQNDQQANQKALESDQTKKEMQMSLGAQPGSMTSVIGKVMSSPKAVGALMNNSWVVRGFMSRASVKAATASPDGLANYLKGPGPMNFINNPIVKAAMNNPAIVSAVASSSMVGALLNTPAAQALMTNPQALSDLMNSNPQLVAMAMQNPQTLNMLMSNPDVSGIIGKFNTSKISLNN